MCSNEILVWLHLAVVLFWSILCQWIHSMLVNGPCATEIYDGLVSKLLPVLLRALEGAHAGSPEGKPVSRETSSHGSDILGQEVLCWQLSFPGESCQCCSWKAVWYSVSYATERCSTDVVHLACLAVAWGGLSPVASPGEGGWIAASCVRKNSLCRL